MADPSGDYLKSLQPENAKRTRSALVNREYYERIVNVLKGSTEEDRYFRHRARARARAKAMMSGSVSVNVKKKYLINVICTRKRG